MSNHGKPDASTKHFSHPHTLNLINYQSHNNNNNQTLILCSCCNLTLSSNSWVYCCTPCGYFLHLCCSKMPPKITHPSCPSPQHVLTLRPKPDTARHPNGVFSCAACLKPDNCFSYQCKPCGTNLHAACASSPLTLHHQSHHHELRLEFSPPYPNQTFSCGACGRVGVRGWLYRCGSCGFDVHFDCAKAKPPPPPPRPSPMPSQNDVNQRYAEYVMRNHPQMMGTVVTPPFTNYPISNMFYGLTTHNIGGYISQQQAIQQQAIQQQAMMRLIVANNNAANNLATQMMVQSALGVGGPAGGVNTTFGADPSAFGADYGAASGFDFGAMTGSGGGFDCSGFGSS